MANLYCSFSNQTKSYLLYLCFDKFTDRLSNDIGALKSHLQPLIGIPPAMMKVMIKGLAKDEMTLRKLGVAKGSKIMVVGSSINDVLQMSSTPKDIGNSNKKCFFQPPDSVVVNF